ncbi:hypothetical protein D3C86_1372160 [compost metagenome]
MSRKHRRSFECVVQPFEKNFISKPVATEILLLAAGVVDIVDGMFDPGQRLFPGHLIKAFTKTVEHQGQ